MLRRDVVPARDNRDNGARREGFRDDPSLGLIAPPSATPRTDLDIDPTPWLRTVDYMVNHICEPNCVTWVASCSSTRGPQGGERRPLTLDWQMPSADGMEVTRRLRNEPDPALSVVPVVLITAQSGPENTAAGFAAGVTDYLTKPFRPAHVRTRVQAWLLRRPAEAPRDT